jgi:hypothetical protein
MFTMTKIILSAAIIVGAASAAFAGGLPSIDVQKMCRASEAAPFADNTATFDICMSDEQAAREKLVESWAKFPAVDRKHCVLPAEYLPNYVEWLTCLEMERDIREIQQQQSAPQAGKRNLAEEIASLTVRRIHRPNRAETD